MRRRTNAEMKREDEPVLLHERALAAVLEIDVVRIEVALRRKDHDLRHRPV